MQVYNILLESGLWVNILLRVPSELLGLQPLRLVPKSVPLVVIIVVLDLHMGVMDLTIVLAESIVLSVGFPRYFHGPVKFRGQVLRVFARKILCALRPLLPLRRHLPCVVSHGLSGFIKCAICVLPVIWVLNLNFFAIMPSILLCGRLRAGSLSRSVL